MNVFDGLNPGEAKKLYREKVMQCHPDHGGTTADFISINNQYKEYRGNLKSQDTGFSPGDIFNEIFKDNPGMAGVLASIFDQLPPGWQEKNIEEMQAVLNYMDKYQKVKDAISGIINAYNLFKPKENVHNKK